MISTSHLGRIFFHLGFYGDTLEKYFKNLKKHFLSIFSRAISWQCYAGSNCTCWKKFHSHFYKFRPSGLNFANMCYQEDSKRDQNLVSNPKNGRPCLWATEPCFSPHVTEYYCNCELGRISTTKKFNNVSWRFARSLDHECFWGQRLPPVCNAWCWADTNTCAQWRIGHNTVYTFGYRGVP